ncbi:heparan-alpha-glucosaminide N-acetyltransferase [Peptoniphilus sp.]|jgi:uncharacterized membrane protein|uniref:heparan-alpha-glucosaminide N-acetyltransferase n=1 Tax=Peptoniphilus sp. TaxID=1971214 RepID=UPI003D92EA90
MKRYNFIDFWRGITIIAMIIYHTIYDLEAFYGFEIKSNLYYFQQYICWSFIFIAGLSLNFSKNYSKKTMILILISVAITVATYLYSPENVILFGVIHFFASAFLIESLVGEKIKKIDPLKGLIISSILFIILKNIYYGEILFGLIKLSPALYKPNLFFLGLPSKDFYSADYFPIIPWIFLFYAGYFSYNFLKLEKKEASNNFINIMGRHSLVIYFLHQVIIVIALRLIFGY